MTETLKSKLPLVLTVIDWHDDSQPFAGTPSRSRKPARQLFTVHRPLLQPATPFAAWQVFPQPPQWSGLVAKSTFAPQTTGPASATPPPPPFPPAPPVPCGPPGPPSKSPGAPPQPAVRIAA